MQSTRLFTTLIAGVVWLAALPAARAEHGGPAPAIAVAAAVATPSPRVEAKPFPIFQGLGPRRLTVTTASDEAQIHFDQGLAWAYGFNHWAAAQAFRAAQAADPNCAMCYWGEAYVLGPNINDPMHDEALQPAFRAAAAAMALRAGASVQERALIEALAKRYSADPKADRAALDQTYAAAMRAVAATYPNDVDVLVLYAEALMDLQPWDYWEADGGTPRGHGGEVIAILERALRIDRHHPQAIHLYIHAVEASTTPERAEPHADRLAELMPGSGHLVHMPSHTYYRIGRYQDTYVANQAAAQVDEAYLARVAAEPTDIYVAGYYPHNVHFMVVSAQMTGAHAEAIAAAERLGSASSDDIAAAVPLVQAIKTATITAHAQLSEAETILALPEPAARFPLVRAFWHYARGLAYVRRNELAAAAAERQAIAELAKAADLGALVAGMVPAPELFRIATLVLEGRIARAKGDLGGAVRAFEAAVATQDAVPYMEPAYWYYPVRQTLAATHLMNGDAAAAEAGFLAALAETPGNGWALFGLMRCQEKLGRTAEAAATRARLDAVWRGDRDLLKLERL